MTDTTQDTNDRATIGGNNPPPYDVERFASCSDNLDKFNEAAKVWLEIEAVDTEDRAEKLNDFLAGAKKLKARIEKCRKEDKKPHYDAGLAVDAAYKGLADTLSKVDAAIRPKLDAFMEAERQKALAAKAEEERKAREAREEAERKAKAAAAAENDIRAQQEAEDAAKEAEKAEKAAAKEVKIQVGSATGGARTASFRTTRSAEIVAITQVFLHYRDRPEVHDLLKRLADADIRAVDVDETKIPGINIKETRKSV